MKKRIYNIVIVVLLVAGVGILSYPAVSNLWNQFQQDRVMRGYDAAVEECPDDELEAMWQAARQYNEKLLDNAVIVEPFSQAEGTQKNETYYRTLDPWNNGVMGSVRIPKIDVDLPIYHGTKEDVLQKAIGHLEQTSLPVGGEGTHAVVSGHRGLPSATLFTDLNLLEVGDKFYLDILDETLAYEVDQVKVVEPSDVRDLAVVPGEDHVTLVTCTPYAVNSHRLLVRGTRIPYVEESEDVPQPEALPDTAGQSEEIAQILPYIAAVVTAAVAAAAVLIWNSTRKPKKKKKRRKRHGPQKKGQKNGRSTKK